MENPLSHLSEKELILNILKNIERKVLEDTRVEEYDLDGNYELKHWYKNTPNWGKIMTFITCNTSKGGSTSAHQMCKFLGVNPNSKTFYNKEKP